jgi:hypothetical protein
MASLKSQRHHWWPEAVSQFWVSPEDGLTGWIRPNGSVKRLPPKNLGGITNGHAVKYSKDPNDSMGVDASFEGEFERADSAFPAVVRWLDSLEFQSLEPSQGTGRFTPIDSNDAEVASLLECMVSLVVRSPMTREACARLSEAWRGPLAARERNALISMNLWHLQRRFVDGLGVNGKFVVIFSPSREFIFGDGFFSNFQPANLPELPKMLVPMTPRAAVLYVRPIRYGREPRISTLSVDADDADALNLAVQVYAKENIFFRQEQPSVSAYFAGSNHLTFSDSANPVDRLIGLIPGCSA